MHIRNISQARIDSLEENYNVKVNIDDISYTKVGTDQYDLDKCENWVDLAAIERVCKEPRRQSIDESNRLSQLYKAFPGIKQLAKGSKFLVNGKITDSKLSNSHQVDIDALLEDDEWSFPFTLKSGQKEDGGGQNLSVDNLISFIKQAPDENSLEKTILVLDVTGPFWTKFRKKYRGYEKEISKSTFTIIDVLKNEINKNKKKAIVLSDLYELNPNMSIYNTFVKGIFE